MKLPKDSSTNRRILIVDDQESIREDFKKILTSPAKEAGASRARSAFLGDDAVASETLSFELALASQGQEGIDLHRAGLRKGEPFAMAFVDVRMPPGMDGIQTIRGLWEVDDDLQVVICTAYSDYSFEDIMEQLGHSDRLLILKKPFDPVEVRQLAGALTEKWNVIRREHSQMEELRDANDRAESANRAKSEFLANMSHEIRTPMNALLGYIDLMCDPEATPADRVQYGQTVRKSGEHLLAILNDILDVSRIEASRLVVNAADFSPFDLAFEVTSLMRSQAFAKDLRISLEVPDPIPQVIESDLVRARQILLNLIGNAVKFTPSGSVRVVLRLDENVDSEHRYLHFDVVDTGIGIPPQKLETIFEPFSQADTSDTREYGGTGLGLTICKRLALLLGGDVVVESEPGRGTTFSLRLYAGELSRSMLRTYHESECVLDRGPEEPPEPPVEDVDVDGHVLVVEDVKFNQLLVGALLRRAGATVELASNGQEALDAVLAGAGGQEFDLILMDMQMPVMDGYEATRRLRAAGFDKAIVALTARAMAGDREKCIQVGCNDYATKPLDRGSLLVTCSRLLALQRAGAALPSAPSTERVFPE